MSTTPRNVEDGWRSHFGSSTRSFLTLSLIALFAFASCRGGVSGAQATATPCKGVPPRQSAFEVVAWQADSQGNAVPRRIGLTGDHLIGAKALDDAPSGSYVLRIMFDETGTQVLQQWSTWAVGQGPSSPLGHLTAFINLTDADVRDWHDANVRAAALTPFTAQGGKLVFDAPVLTPISSGRFDIPNPSSFLVCTLASGRG